MRSNQVSIHIECFGEYVPKDYPNDVQRIHVYCDDFKSVYAALAKANAMAINQLNEYETIGARSYVCTNEYSKADYREMQGNNPIDRHSYEDDLELQFTWRNNELRKDRIWIYENIDAIIKLICSVEDKNKLKTMLMEKFGLSVFQIKKLLSFRLDMLSKDDYLKDLEEDKESEDSEKNIIEGWSDVQQARWHDRCIREAKKKLSEYNTYITIAENYKDMITIISENPDRTKYAKIIEERYGLDIWQVFMLERMTVAVLLSLDKYKEKLRRKKRKLNGIRKRWKINRE